MSLSVTLLNLAYVNDIKHLYKKYEVVDVLQQPTNITTNAYSSLFSVLFSR